MARNRNPLDPWNPRNGALQAFVDVLKIGADQPLTASQLVTYLGDHLGQDASRSMKERRLRFLVELALEFGHPVCANTQGYFLADSMADLRHYAAKLRGHADGLERKAKMVETVIHNVYAGI